MNKIFKTVWNHTTQTLTVASELAKSHSQSTSQSTPINTTKKFRLTTLVTILGLTSLSAYSDIRIGSTTGDTLTPTGTSVTNSANNQITDYKNPDNTRGATYNNGQAVDTIVIGNNTQSTTGGVAIGGRANAGLVAVALGSYAYATDGSSALGFGARAEGDDSFAAMRQASAKGKNTIAVGSVSRSKGEGAIAMGKSAFAEGKHSIAIGSSNTDNNNYDSVNNTHANGEGSIALGHNAKATLDNAVALGRNAKTTLGNSVALGSDSETVSAGTILSKVQIGDYNYTNNQALTPKYTDYVVSVGSQSKNIFRQIQQVANGKITADSSDAINGAQLHSALTTVGTELSGLKNNKADKSTFFHIKANNAIAKTWKLDKSNEINFTSANRNLIVTPKDGAVQYELNKDLRLGDDGTLIVGGISLENAGMSLNDKEIRNVKAMDLTSYGKYAATTGQLYTVDQKATNAAKGVESLNGRMRTVQDTMTRIDQNGRQTSNTVQVLERQQRATDKTLTDLTTKTDTAIQDIDDLKATQAKVNARTYTIGNGYTSPLPITNGKAGSLANDNVTLYATRDLAISTNGKGQIMFGLSEQTKTNITTANATANVAKKLAEETAGKVTGLTADAAEALKTAKEAKTQAQSADSKATEVKTIVTNAQNTANTALTQANNANTKADQAITTANAAKNELEKSTKLANEAKDSASKATTTAQTASDTATTALNKAISAETAVGHLQNRQYKFNVANGKDKANNESGNADTWTLSKNDEITFGATEDLNVSSDGNGNIIYGLSDGSKQAIKDAKTAAETVKDKLTDINNAVSEAKNAKTVAETAANTATNKADEATQSAKNAADSAKNAENSATKADQAKQAAETAKIGAKTAKAESETPRDESKGYSEEAKQARDSAMIAKQGAENAAINAKQSENNATNAADSAKNYYSKIEKTGLIQNGKTAFAASNQSNKDSSKAEGRDATAVGFGSNASGNQSNAFGHSAQATAENATAIGHNAQAKGANAVAIGHNSVADEENTVSVGNDTIQRRVINVAVGKDPHDAVNVKQLNEVKGAVDSVRSDLRKTDKRLRGGIAGSTAIAGLPQATKAGGNIVSVGVGGYQDQNAIAIGYSKATDNNKIIFKVSGAANTQGKINYSGSVGYQW